MTDASPTKRKRVEWIDLAKGIAILLVIIGHTVQDLPRGIIFSFHMPLFFILSGYTFRFSESADQFIRKTQSAFRHLVFPAFGIFLARIFFIAYLSHFDQDWNNYITRNINKFIYASGAKVDVMGGIVPDLGMPWFLIVLFLARTIYDYIHFKYDRKRFVAAICLLTLAGFAIGSFQWLPFSLDLALAVLPFFAFATIMKKMDLEKRPFLYALVSLLIWAGCFYLCWSVKGEYLEFSYRHYSFLPFSYIGAMAATLCISCLSIIIEKLLITKPLKYLGRYSLYLLCIHSMDYLITDWLSLTENIYLNAIARLAYNLAIFIIVMTLRYIIIKIHPGEKNPADTSKEV